MGTCDTCKNWVLRATSIYKPEYRRCNRFKEQNFDDEESFDNSVILTEIDCMCSVAITGPKFGCIHWGKENV